MTANRTACKAPVLIAVIAAAAASASACASTCEAMPPITAGLEELIVSPATLEKREDFRKVLERAQLSCVAEIEATGDCLVRYRSDGHPKPRVAAPLLKANIHALSGGAFDARDQALIGDVFVNEGIDVQTTEPVVTLPPGTVIGTPRASDPKFHKQVQLRALNAEVAWEGIGAHEPIVAVLDNGVWLEHPDLKPNLHLPGVTIGCQSSPCDGSPAKPTAGHGTKVAGVIAAEKDNNEGIIGTAWNAKILPINIDAHGTTDFTAACGVEAAIKRGATIINASWWKTARLKLLRKRLLLACDDVVFVAAAGSDGFRISEKHPSYPLLEELPNVIGVAANWDTDDPLPNSNYSPRFVHVTAESETYTTQYPTAQNPELYAYALGHTSYSTAYVSGIVALLKSRYPSWRHEWLKWRVINGSLFSQRLKHMSESQGRIDLGAIMFPVSATAATLGGSRMTVLDWSKGLRGDMCARVSIDARIGELGQMGQYKQVEDETLNDGQEPIASNLLPEGTGSRIQFLVTCIEADSNAESPALVLVR
jgi:hypothetical protein